MNAYNQQFSDVKETEDTDVAVFTTKSPTYNLNNGIEILKALNLVQAEIIALGGIAKARDTESNNAAFRFKFRGIDDIYNVISDLLVKHKIVVSPHVERCQCTKHITKKGDVTFKTHVVVRYTLLSSIDGSYLESCLIGESNDTTDKSSSKALSAAQKYLFIQTFSIPTSTDNQADQQNQQKNTYQQNRQYQQQNAHPPEQANTRTVKTVRYASLAFKNHVDEYMKKNNNRLCNILKNLNINMEDLTHEQLRKIVFDFDQYLRNQTPT